MHDRKGDGRQNANRSKDSHLPADYSEWVSQKVCEIGLPNSQEATQTVFPFARLLGNRTLRAKRANFEGSWRRALLVWRTADWLKKLLKV